MASAYSPERDSGASGGPPAPSYAQKRERDDQLPRLYSLYPGGADMLGPVKRQAVEGHHQHHHAPPPRSSLLALASSQHGGHIGLGKDQNGNDTYRLTLLLPNDAVGLVIGKVRMMAWCPKALGGHG